MRRILRSSAVEAALLAALSIFVLSGIDRVPFHPDEASLLFESRDLESLLARPLDMAWDPLKPSSAEMTYRLLNAPLPKYVLGLGRALAGFGPETVAVDWDWSKTWTQNAIAGALPPRDLLAAARTASATRASPRRRCPVLGRTPSRGPRRRAGRRRPVGPQRVGPASWPAGDGGGDSSDGPGDRMPRDPVSRPPPLPGWTGGRSGCRLEDLGPPAFARGMAGGHLAAKRSQGFVRVGRWPYRTVCRRVPSIDGGAAARFVATSRPSCRADVAGTK